MSNLECKHRLYKKVGLIGKAFSHEVRLELIELLSQCPQTVEKLSEMLDEDYKSISAHLRVLYRAGLVTCTRNGRFQRYGLASPKVTALAVMIRETAEQSIAELPCLEAESGIPNASLGIEDAVHYASEGKLILLDVRPAEEFAAGHLPHAINMPIEMLGKRMHELPRGMALAAYCRGPYCFLAHEAAAILEASGRRLQVIPSGVMEWSSRGAELESASPEESQKKPPRRGIRTQARVRRIPDEGHNDEIPPLEQRRRVFPLGERELQSSLIACLSLSPASTAS